MCLHHREELCYFLIWLLFILHIWLCSGRPSAGWYSHGRSLSSPAAARLRHPQAADADIVAPALALRRATLLLREDRRDRFLLHICCNRRRFSCRLFLLLALLRATWWTKSVLTQRPKPSCWVWQSYVLGKVGHMPPTPPQSHTKKIPYPTTRYTFKINVNMHIKQQISTYSRNISVLIAPLVSSPQRRATAKKSYVTFLSACCYFACMAQEG